MKINIEEFEKEFIDVFLSIKNGFCEAENTIFKKGGVVITLHARKAKDYDVKISKKQSNIVKID